MKSWKKNFTLAGMRECWTERRLLERGRAISKFCMEFY